MSQTLKFSIEVETHFFDEKYAAKIRNRLIKGLIAEIPESMSFEELNSILFLGGLKFYVKSVDFSQKYPDTNESITKFVITG